MQTIRMDNVAMIIVELRVCESSFVSRKVQISNEKDISIYFVLD